MLRYEGITFIQDVEVDDWSIQLAPLICVATYYFSYTPPKLVPLVHNGFAYKIICSNVDLDYFEGALIRSVGSHAQARRYLE
jgi:hypothetical protein